jgi:hypothetical protein
LFFDETKATVYSEFFLRLAIGFYMLIFQPPVNFCSDENIQTIFGTNLEDFLNYRIDYNSISQTVEKVVKKIFFLARRKRPKLEIVRCWLSRQWRYSGGRSTYYYFGALKNIFSQLFRRFGILNCNLSDSLKNLPTLFQKWFGYFYRNKS